MTTTPSFVGLRKPVLNKKLQARDNAHMKNKGPSTKVAPDVKVIPQKKDGTTTAEVQTPPSPDKRKTTPNKVTTEEPLIASKWKKTWTKVNVTVVTPKGWDSSITDGKGEPILMGAKSMSDPDICKGLMWAMILPSDYDVAINISREDHRES